MKNYIIKNLHRIAFYLYIIFLFFLPLFWEKITDLGEVFPALDIIIIYYFSTCRRVKYWHLFIAGIFIDSIHYSIIGMTSFSLIMGNIFIRKIENYFFLEDYIHNISVFAFYSFLVILIKLVITSLNGLIIDKYVLVFYYLTTIFFYPIFLFTTKRLIAFNKLHEKG